MFEWKRNDVSPPHHRRLGKHRGTTMLCSGAESHLCLQLNDVHGNLENVLRDSLSVFMRPPAVSWCWLLLSLLVLITGMLCLAGADVCSSSKSLLLELSSLLEDEELLESEELSPLLSWSMTRASAINSAHASKQKAHEARANRRTVTKIADPSKGGNVLRLPTKWDACSSNFRWIFCLAAPLSMSSMGGVGDTFSLGGELLELVKDLLLLLLLLFICWPRRLVCCSSREWILLLPSALKINRSKLNNNQEKGSKKSQH